MTDCLPDLGTLSSEEGRQVKATDQQLDSATGGVMVRDNVEREISSTTISSTTPWPDQW